MISRHLMKMLLGLVGMGLFGIICLVVINLYYKDTTTTGSTTGMTTPQAKQPLETTARVQKR